MMPDYRDDIEETILPDSDSEKEAQEADVKPAVDDTSENRNEESNEEKDKGKTGISVVADRIFDFLVMAGQYFCHIIADVFSKPAVYVAYAAVFIWKHTALFRDAVKRTFCEIGSFFFAPLLKSKRVLHHRTLEFADVLVALPVHPLGPFIYHICNDLIASLVDDTA